MWGWYVTTTPSHESFSPNQAVLPYIQATNSSKKKKKSKSKDLEEEREEEREEEEREEEDEDSVGYGQFEEELFGDEDSPIKEQEDNKQQREKVSKKGRLNVESILEDEEM